MKKVEDWLKELPAPANMLATWHHRNRLQKENIRMSGRESMIAALMVAFDWEDTPEGALFWCMIAEMYCTREQLQAIKKQMAIKYNLLKNISAN